MSTRRPTLRDQILAAMQATGMTMFEIARQSGVERAALSRFKSGKGGLTLDSLERLAPVLGIEIATTAPAIRSDEQPKTRTIRFQQTTIVRRFINGIEQASSPSKLSRKRSKRRKGA